LYGLVNCGSLEITKSHAPFFAELRVNAGQDWAWAVVTKSFHRWEAASICLLSAENGDRNFIQRKRFVLQAGHTPAARTERQNYDGGRIHRYKRGVCDYDCDRYRCLYHGSPAKALNIGTAAHTVQPKAPLSGRAAIAHPKKAKTRLKARVNRPIISALRANTRLVPSNKKAVSIFQIDADRARAGIWLVPFPGNPHFSTNLGADLLQ
jgi:hypothetical protein